MSPATQLAVMTGPANEAVVERGASAESSRAVRPSSSPMIDVGHERSSSNSVIEDDIPYVNGGYWRDVVALAAAVEFQSKIFHGSKKSSSPFSGKGVRKGLAA